MGLNEKFDNCSSIIKDIFMNDYTKRLNTIYKKSESCWNDNFDKRIKNIKVKYLLIAEAPPWTKECEVSYFYNNFKGNFCKKIYSGILNKNLPQDVIQIFNELTDKQFLLIDTLPFALDYTSSLRKSEKYIDLMKSSKSYWIDKLNKVSFDDNLIYGFAVTLNARAFGKAFPEGVNVNGKNIIFREELIIADCSGYPSSDKIRNLFCI